VCLILIGGHGPFDRSTVTLAVKASRVRLSGPFAYRPPMQAKPSVLIAEDDSSLAGAYRSVFAGRFRVRVARDGEEAERMIAAEPPDLLICDLQMPVRDGWWLLGQFPRAERQFPVLVATNLDDAGTRRRCAALGADGYCVKLHTGIHELLALADRLLTTKVRPRRRHQRPAGRR
jgi:DNA-binding response OmpR family regulator